MDLDTCFICFQPLPNCGGRSDRRAFSFDVMMTPGHRHMVVVPCCVKERINEFCGKRLVVKCPRGYKYDLFVEEFEARKLICGPYWRAFVEAYDINVYDVVHFCFDPEVLENPAEYEVVAYDLDGDEKEWAIPQEVGFHCKHVLPKSRRTFEKTVFSNIFDITDAEMCEVNWAIFKELRKFNDEDFFEVPQFFVHRMGAADLIQLNILAEIAQGYTFPCHGPTILWSRRMTEELYGSYEHHKGQPITLGHAWAEFCAELGVEVGTLIIMKIEMWEFGIMVEVDVLTD